MTRRQSREHLFKMLFRIEFNKTEELSEQADYYLESLDNLTDVQVLKKRFLQIVEKLPEIDKTISKISTGWTINRMGKVDLTALRIAVFEIKFDDEIPGEVSINEAVEIAKKYGEESSGSFVNGVLAKLLR